MNMKISMFGTLPPLKGNAYYCWHLSQALAQKVEVEFFTFKRLYPNFLYPGGTEEPDVRLNGHHTFDIHRSLDILNPLTWLQASGRARGDIVHVQFWSLPVVPAWLTILTILKRRKKRKSVVTVHNTSMHEPSAFDNLLLGSLLKLADRCIVHYEQGVDDLHQTFGIPREHVFYIPMGTHGELYKKTLDRLTPGEAKKALNIDEDARVLLFFGNIREYKGADDFLRALAIVRDRYPGKVVGIIAGQIWGKFDPYQQIIDAHNLQDNVKCWLHYIPMQEVSKFFFASDIVVLPYKKMGGQSGVGNIALEFHKPMVVTQVGGLPDLVIDKQFAVEPCNPEAMAERILQILADESLAKKLSEDSRTLLQKNSWDSITDKMVEIYNQIV